MEAAATTRGGALPMSSSRKEWRAVSDHHHHHHHHHSVRNAGDEVDLEQQKLGQSDERTIYEQGREPADVDFCSITMDGSLDNDNLLQQRLHSVARQREDMQHLEIELRAQIIARTEMMDMQNSFDAQIKEHTSATAKLQEQLLERDQTIHELERKMEEKERELHAIKLDNEAAWAKEDLFREQNKELATFRRERDHSEAERAQHIKQIHDLQEHIQEKERQLIDLQEQHRAAQETIIYKDEQLREAQAWVARVQLQSTTNQSLQAELRERTEQFNQLWLGCQRQFAEMERLHLHAIQQLQHELADARNGTFTEEARLTQKDSKDVTQFGQSNGNQLDVNGGGATNTNSVVLPNGNADNAASYVSSANASTQSDRVPGVPIGPSSLLGLPTYLPPGQVPTLHSFIMHQQGVPHPSHVPQSHVGHFHSMPTMSSLQQWQNQQAASEVSQMSAPNQLAQPQTDQSLMRPDAKYEYDMPVNGQALHSGYLDVQINQGTEPDSVISSSAGEAQVLETIDRNYMVAPQPEQNLQQISAQFHEALRLNTLDQNSEAKEQNDLNLADHGLPGEVAKAEQPSAVANACLSDASVNSVNIAETAINNETNSALPEALISSGQMNTLISGKTSEHALLDERSLLACIVRTIPPGGRIRISSTLPTRLGKMIAPLHWHDYKKQYGKLDDFVAGHPELFVIDGDYIQLREGAKEMIAATAAYAKVAAAAAASSPYSSALPSVAVTPMAQSRLKKVPSVDSNSVIQNQHLNGVNFGMVGGLSNVKILSKPRDPFHLNGANFERSNVINTQSKGSTQGKPNLVGKQQGRATGAALTSRR